jgi:ABC-type Fe3+/spermidine/putrescine transport system ATPase subunit
VEDVFNNPSNRFVARYAGIRNFFRVDITGSNGTLSGVTKNNVTFKLSDVSTGKDKLLLIKNDSLILHNELPADSLLNTIKGKVAEIIPSEYGMEVTVDAGDIFYVNILTSDMMKLNLVENKEIWVSFPVKDIVVLNGN